MSSSTLRLSVALRLAAPLLASSLLAACLDHGSAGAAVPAGAAPDPPELLAGERLFLEGRFAQFFAARAGGHLNTPLAAGDPQLDRILLDGVLVASPFAGETFSCAACHMVDQAADLAGGGIRTYDDFARRSPVPLRTDGLEAAPRNSPPLVNASIARPGPTLFHADGEFATLRDLVVATLLGRNYGWLPSERAAAVAHVAAVVRQDDGGGALASEFGGVPFAALLDDGGAGVPDAYRLPPAFTVDLASASDEQIVGAVAALIAAYTADLAFSRDVLARYDGSPYDTFLRRNGLPTGPDGGETPAAYARRLADALDALAVPHPVPANPDGFASHEEAFAFGPAELEGLRAFLRGPAQPGQSTGVGNCAACHTPPDFTDFGLHNAGFSQDAYDRVHGPGAFLLLDVPDLASRQLDPEGTLPPTSAHPDAQGPFRAAVDPARPGRADLGLWNVFANDDLSAPQEAIRAVLSSALDPATAALPDADLLPHTLGLFKTPGLRDLGHAGPYGHDGQFDRLDEVLVHYLQFSSLARSGFVRNADPRLAGIALGAADLAPLAAFLRALNEDYE